MGMKKVLERMKKGYAILSKRHKEEFLDTVTEKMQQPSAQPIYPQYPQPTVIMPQMPAQVQITSLPVPIPVQIQASAEPIIIPIQTQVQPQQQKEPQKMELIRPKEKFEIEGFEIPDIARTKPKIGKLAEEREPRLSLIYPLIPKKPAKNEPIFAYAKIEWDNQKHRYVYNVIEPKMPEKIKNDVKKIEELLEQKLDIDFTKLKLHEAKGYLRSQIEELLVNYRFSLTQTEKQILFYYIERDFVGLGKIEPLLQDEQIEDISCDGVNIPVFVFHRNSVLGSIMTNVVYEDKDDLDTFITRLAQLAGKSVSMASPLLNGSLPNGSRIQATLATDIARRGSNLTIRKFTEKPLTPIHLLKYGTIDVKTLTFLWMAVDFGKNILISGGTASGKTSLLNVLSLFIRPDKKIVSIEDTPELKLPHSHWIPHVARTSVTSEIKKIGEVDLFDLLKESLRQRPDYIIVGEVRGKEAFILFQEMATGHPSMATIHAENAPKLLDRLTTQPISLPPTLIASLDAIVFLSSTRYRDRQVRRVTEVVEVVGLDAQTKEPIFNDVLRWNPMNDRFEINAKSSLLRKIALSKGLKEEELLDEFGRRMMVLRWMEDNNITDYKDVNTVVNMYYNYPERVIANIMGGG